MRLGPLAHLRALILLVALGFGLAGQAVASVGMPMMQDAGPGLTATTGGSEACPGCDRNDPSQALAPNCAVAFCSVSPAILPQGPTLKRAPHTTFRVASAETKRGITVRPDLGPPRPIPHA